MLFKTNPFFATLFLIPFYLAAQEPAPRRQVAPPENDHQKLDQEHAQAPEQRPDALLNALGQSQNKVDALTKLATELQKGGGNPDKVFAEIFDRDTINVTEVSAAAQLYFRTPSAGNEKLKFLLTAEAMGLSRLKLCWENYQTETNTLEELGCGLNATVKKEGNAPEIWKRIYDKKVREWSYLLGVSPTKVKEIFNTLESAGSVDSVAAVFAELMGAQPVAARKAIASKLKHVANNNDEALFRNVLLASIEWSQKKEDDGTPLRKAFNTWFFEKNSNDDRESVQQNKETFWSLVDRAQTNAEARQELLAEYSENLPTFIRTLHEQASNPEATELERKKAGKMLTDILNATALNKDGKRLLPLADLTDPSKVREVDVSGEHFGSLQRETKYKESPPPNTRYIPSSSSAIPSIYSSLIPHAGDSTNPPPPPPGEGPGEQETPPSSPKPHSGEERTDTEGATPSRPPLGNQDPTPEFLEKFIGGEVQNQLTQLNQADASKTSEHIQHLVKKNGSSVYQLLALRKLSTGLDDTNKQNQLDQAILEKVKERVATKIIELRQTISQATLHSIDAIENSTDQTIQANVESFVQANLNQQEEEREAIYEYFFHKSLTEEKWRKHYGKLIESEINARNGILQKKVKEAVEKNALPKGLGDFTIEFASFLGPLLSSPTHSMEFQYQAAQLRTMLQKYPDARASITLLAEALGFGKKGKFFIPETP